MYKQISISSYDVTLSWVGEDTTDLLCLDVRVDVTTIKEA